MCLLVALIDVVAGHPFVCAANRDESHDRASDPPAARGGDPAVWCGLDRRAGGTWLGLNAAGVAVVLTNRRGGEDAARPSRGAAARAALATRSAFDAVSAAVGWARDEAPNPFTLFAADARESHVAAYDVDVAGARSASVRAVPPGVRTLTSLHDLDELPAAALLAAAGLPADAFPRGVSLADAEARLLDVVRSHAPLQGSRRAACVHGDRRGTVSSALLAVDAAGRPARYLAADGPPCVTAFRTVL